MPKSGFCSVCYARVWLAEDGSCSAGHAPWAVSDVHDTPEGAPDAPGGSNTMPPTVTVVPPPNVIEAPVELTVPSDEVRAPDAPPPAVAGPELTPEGLADSAARLAHLASEARAGTGPVAPDIAAALRQGDRNVRTLLIVALAVVATWCCCCTSPWLALFSGDDAAIESTDATVTPAFPPADVVTDTIDPDALAMPVLPPVDASASVPATGSAAATASGAEPYYVVMAATAPYDVTDVVLGTTSMPGGDPHPVSGPVEKADLADVTLSFVLPDTVATGTMFSGELYSGSDGAKPELLETAGPGALDPGSALARFSEPEGGWMPFTVYEIRLLSADQLIATAYFAITK